MEYVPTIIAIFLAHIIIMITPGPNTLLIAQTSATNSRVAGLLVALGVATMGLIWPILAIIGLGVILAKVGWIYSILKIVGGLYLIYLGYKSWRSAGQPVALTPSSVTHKHRKSFYFLGFFTSLSNPKVIIFMGSFFTSMLPITSPTWVKIVVIIVFAINSLWWHTLVAYAFSTARVQNIYRASKSWLERVTGGVFMVLGARLALTNE